MRKQRQSAIRTTKREVSIQAIQPILIESENFTNQMESNALPLYQSDDKRIGNTVHLFERTKSVSGFGSAGGIHRRAIVRKEGEEHSIAPFTNDSYPLTLLPEKSSPSPVSAEHGQTKVLSIGSGENIPEPK